MRSGNPSLTKSTFSRYEGMTYSNTMTLYGTIAKSFILLVLVVAAAIYSWNLYFAGEDVTGLILVGAVGSLIIGLITVFIPKIAPFTAPVYAVLEGLFIGAISANFESAFQGITLQAILITFGVFLALLLAYTSRLIKPSQNFRLGVAAATGGIFLVYLTSFILSFFGITVPYLHDNSTIGIGISIFIVIIAALNLVLDFDFIEHGTHIGAPKYMEWYGAFGLMVTLIWLYLEILRLLAKINSRD
jgi:uncharacterized YccA/Bax inhibitor family protein